MSFTRPHLIPMCTQVLHQTRYSMKGTESSPLMTMRGLDPPGEEIEEASSSVTPLATYYIHIDTHPEFFSKSGHKAMVHYTNALLGLPFCIRAVCRCELIP